MPRTKTKEPPAGDVAARVRALRDALEMTQEQVALAGGGDLRSSFVAQVEGGYNALGKYEKRKAVAHGLGLHLDIFDMYIAGDLTLGQVAVMARAEHRHRAKTAPGRHDPILAPPLPRGMLTKRRAAS